ncbi:MAG: serine protease [Deltaproteobacteria bacterium]|nr:serine protease [Deltaproteobacteria bacterium]
MYPAKVLLAVTVVSSLLLGCGADLQGDEAPVPLDTQSAAIAGGFDVRGSRLVPYMVSVQQELYGYTSHACGGTLIGQGWVLTAAHCAYDAFTQTMPLPPSMLSVVIGDLDLVSVDPSARHAVTEVVIHPGFAPRLFDNDVALLRVATAPRAALAYDREHSAAFPYADGLTLGWGMVTLTEVPPLPAPPAYLPPHFYGGSDQLQGLVVHSLSTAECKSRFAADEPEIAALVSDRHVCIASVLPGERGVCQGDSGGPLVVYDRRQREFVVAGVTSFGAHECGSSSHPQVFTRISSFADFVHQTTGF